MPAKPGARRVDRPPISLRADQVDRWRVAQHHLLDPLPSRGLVRACSDVIAIHAQLASAGALQLRARVAGITASKVQAAVADHRLVKTWAMRGTLHLVAGGDLPLLVAALGARTRHTSPAWLKYFEVTLGEMEGLFRALPKALDGRALTREELADEMGRLVAPSLATHLRSGWGTLLKPAAFMGLLCFGPSQGQRVTFVRPDQWVKGWRASDASPDEALADLARRFLHRYGPGTHADFAHYYGTTPPHGKRVFATIESELAQVEVDGQRMWTLAADTAKIASLEPFRAAEPHVRLLPHFDPYVLFYEPRDRLVPAARHIPRVFRQSAWISPVVLVNGLVAGVWASQRTKAGTRVTVEPFRRLSPPERREIAEEVEAIGSFVGARAEVAYSDVA